MAIPKILVRPIDYTTLPVIHGSDLNAGFDGQTFAVGYGVMLSSDTAPDVTSYPEYAFFIWNKTDSSVVPFTPTGQLYIYNPAVPGWQPINLYNGALINNHSIPLVKLVNGSALQVPQMAADGSVAQWVNVSALFSAGTIGITALTNSPSGTYFLESNGATNTWTSLATVLTQLVNFPVTNLVPAPASAKGKLLSTDPTGATVSWTNAVDGSLISGGTLPPAAITPGTNGQIVGTVGTAVQWIALPISEKRVYATSAVTNETGATQTLSLGFVLPSGAQNWFKIELFCAATLNSAGGATVNGTVTFAWNTAPLSNTNVTIGAGAGAGSSGRTISPDHDTVSTPTWSYLGEVPGAIANVATLTVTATLTLSGNYDLADWQFYGVAYCY